MNKLEMAHEWAIETMRKDGFQKHYMQETVRLGWEYADTMQAEADKREAGIEDLMKDEISGFFINIKTNDVIYSESDIISHHWRRIPANVDFVALRLIDSKMFFCVASEVDEDKFKVIWKRPKEEWQPDWSQAPSRMNYYFMNRDGGEYWTVNKPDELNMTEHVMDFRDCGGDCYSYASSQNYQGNWQDSLRTRPQ